MPGIKRRKGLHKPKKAKQKRKNPALASQRAPPTLTDLLSWLTDTSRPGATTSDLCGASTPHSRNVLSSLRYLYHYQTNHSDAAGSMFSTEDLKFLIVTTADQELIALIRAAVASSGKIICEPGAPEGKPN